MTIRVCIAALLIGAGLVACGVAGGPKEITETRTAAPPAKDVNALPAADSASPHGDMPQPHTWKAPEGWVKMPPTPMRLANFKIGTPPEAECYLSVLKGSGGGTELNINRWRTQMGIEAALDAAAIDKLPKITIAGQSVPLVEASGEYRGMSGAPQPNYMLLGAICERESESLFIKMIGPEATVRAQKDNFIAFCASVQ